MEAKHFLNMLLFASRSHHTTYKLDEYFIADHILLKAFRTLFVHLELKVNPYIHGESASSQPLYSRGFANSDGKFTCLLFLYYNFGSLAKDLEMTIISYPRNVQVFSLKHQTGIRLSAPETQTLICVSGILYLLWYSQPLCLLKISYACQLMVSQTQTFSHDFSWQILAQMHC